MRYNEYHQEKDNFKKVVGVLLGLVAVSAIVMSGIVPTTIGAFDALSLQTKLFSLTAMTVLSYIGFYVTAFFAALEDTRSIYKDGSVLARAFTLFFIVVGVGSGLTLAGYFVWRLFSLL